MDTGKSGLFREAAIGPFRIHAEIARVGAHIARDKSLGGEDGEVGVFDGGNMRGLDLQITLHIQQRFAERGAFAAHDIAQGHVEIVEFLDGRPGINAVMRVHAQKALPHDWSVL